MKKLVISLIVIASLALAATEAQETLIIDLEQSLIAPCCWSGTVYDHGHSEMEREIRRLVVEDSLNKEQILDYFVKLHGERILASPAATGFNLMAWIAPILIALIGIAVFINYLRTPKAIAASSKSQQQPKEKIPFDEQIERELKSFN